MRSLIAGLVVLAISLSSGTLAMLTGAANGLLGDAFSNGNNSYATDTLNPPTVLAATSGTSITLTWTATADTYAGGHRLLRATSSGGPYSQIAEITPRTITTYADNPPAAGTYYYVARAFYGNWESPNSNEAPALLQSTTGFRDCSTTGAVTVSSGDNDGFQTNPGGACGDGGGYAEDTNSGTGNPDTCSSVTKDRHLFYDFGFIIPAGSTINGVEVRLDAWADQTSFGPFMCVELSWNAGVAWTASKSTSVLTTTETIYTLGSSSDTWGVIWSASNFTNGNFRVRVADVSGFNGRDFRLDRVAVRITYTPP